MNKAGSGRGSPPMSTPAATASVIVLGAMFVLGFVLGAVLL